MKKYSQINTLKEFQKSIAGLDEIGSFERDGYKGFQYNVAFPETFNTDAAKECRGIVFDTQSGKVIRRPFDKFFNVNEKEHTQLIDLAEDEILWVTDKLDGTLISPFELPSDGSIYWGTKRCAKDFHAAVVNYLDTCSPDISKEYDDFVRHCITCNYTPMFEFHDPGVSGTVIVLQYNKAFLRLIGIREMSTGEYVDINKSRGLMCDNFPKVEIVSRRKVTSLQEIKDELENLENEEGRVIMLREKGLVKMKTPWYFKRHHIKNMFEFDHIKAQLVLDINDSVSIDDISTDMLPEDVVNFEHFALELRGQIDNVKFWLLNESSKYKTRKEYGLSEKVDNMFSGGVFRVIGAKDPNQVAYNIALDQLKKNTSKSIRFNEWQEAVSKL